MKTADTSCPHFIVLTGHSPMIGTCGIMHEWVQARGGNTSGIVYDTNCYPNNHLDWKELRHGGSLGSVMQEVTVQGSIWDHRTDMLRTRVITSWCPKINLQAPEQRIDKTRIK